MLRLKTTWHTTVMGKDVYNINLEANGISPLRHEFNKLKGETVLIDGEAKEIIGIEAFATGPEYKHSDIGIMVKPKI